MDPARKRELKALGKAEVKRRSAELRAALDEANPARPGDADFARNHRSGTERGRWLRNTLPTLHRAELEAGFVVMPVSGTWSPHPEGYVQCTHCGSAMPSMLPPRRRFYWSSCACGNLRWRVLLFWRRARVRDREAVLPVKLIARS